MIKHAGLPEFCFDLEIKKLESLSMKSCSFPEFPVDFYGSWLCCDRIRISSDIHLKLHFAHCLAPPHGLKDFETWCFCLNLSGSDECFFQPLEHKTPDWDHHAKCFKWNRFEATNQTIIHYSFAGMCLSSLDNCGPLPTLPFWQSGPFFG